MKSGATCWPVQWSVGINDEFCHSGPAGELLKQFGLCAGHIVEGEIIMSEKKSNEYYSGRKNLVFATLISIPGPLALAISMADAPGATQMADLIRRSCEFLTIFSALLVYEITARDRSKNDISRIRLEVFVQYFTGLSMGLSGAAMIYTAIANFGGEKGSVTASLVLAIVGVIVNAKLYINYRAMKNAVLSVQAKLHRVKMLLDGFMVLLLLIWILSPSGMVKSYADIIGSCSISIYLIWNGIRILLERTAQR